MDLKKEPFCIPIMTSVKKKSHMLQMDSENA